MRPVPSLLSASTSAVSHTRSTIGHGAKRRQAEEDVQLAAKEARRRAYNLPEVNLFFHHASPQFAKDPVGEALVPSWSRA